MRCQRKGILRVRESSTHAGGSAERGTARVRATGGEIQRETSDNPNANHDSLVSDCCDRADARERSPPSLVGWMMGGFEGLFWGGRSREASTRRTAMQRDLPDTNSSVARERRIAYFTVTGEMRKSNAMAKDMTSRAKRPS